MIGRTSRRAKLDAQRTHCRRRRSKRRAVARGRSGASRDRGVAVLRRIAQASSGSGSNAKSFLRQAGRAVHTPPSSPIEAAYVREGRSGASRDRVASVLRRGAQARSGSGSNAKSFRH
ncbi:hypothetical protein GLA29479_3189 [Lysobacter antibioticus]|nr:hypothetical protein GLA29479_3189 [Lysobacter antibioticus]